LNFDINLQGKHAAGPFQYYSLRTPDPFIIFFGGIVPTKPWQTSATGPSGTNENYGLAALTLNWKTGIGDLKSITAYQHYKIHALTDQDATNADIFNSDYRLLDRTFTQELNLNSKVGPVDSIIGAFYMKERGRRDQMYTYPFAGGLTGDYLKHPQNVESKAIYADLTWHVSDRFRLIGGARYSRDDQLYRVDQVDPVFGKDVHGCPTEFTKLRFHSTTWKAGAQYDVAEAQNVYGTVSTGYLAGGLNELNCPVENTYKPEKITAYELGYKGRILDNHVNFATAAFYYDFTDLQVSQLTSGAQRIVTNAGASTVKGAELEVNWVPDRHWLVGINGTYLNAKYDRYQTVDVLTGLPFDAAGKRLNNSPQFSGNLTTAYRTGEFNWGELVFRADVAARSRFYFRPTNEPADAQPGYGLVNLSAAWNSRGDRYTFRVFGNNITNKAYYVTMDAAGGVGRYVTFGTPRKIGAEFIARF
jgi:iron complex outermembrane receptor protein